MRRLAISLNDMLDRFPHILREVSNDVVFEISLTPQSKPAAILRPAFLTVVGTSMTEVQAKTHFRSLIRRMAANNHAPVRIEVLGSTPVDLSVV